MFLTAPETKGKTLEEMDDVFDSGLPAWRSVKKGSRLDQLQRDIEAGKVKIGGPLGGLGVGEKREGMGEREREKEVVVMAHREDSAVL